MIGAAKSSTSHSLYAIVIGKKTGEASGMSFKLSLIVRFSVSTGPLPSAETTPKVISSPESKLVLLRR